MIGLLGSMMGARGGRMLGGMIGGRTGAMVGGMIGSMIAGRKLGRLGRSVGGGGGLGGLIGGLTGQGDGDQQASGLIGEHPQGDSLTEGEAEILVRLMCNSAKADGQVDRDEAARIAQQVGDEVSDDERAFLSAELSSPFVAPDTIAAQVPSELSAEAYAVSLLAIDIDTAAENSYVADLAAALGLTNADRAEIHQELGLA
jgi:uncharacterized membrane protein YebE (DUF533 family)